MYLAQAAVSDIAIYADNESWELYVTGETSGYANQPIVLMGKTELRIDRKQ